jgi:hypothetical protein
MIDSFKLLFAIVFVFVSGELQADQQIWQPIAVQAHGDDPNTSIFIADQTALRASLDAAPHEIQADRSHVIDLPMPDGSLESFAVVESPVMQPGLASRYPEVKTFKLYGIAGSIASGRADITAKGFHAMLHLAGDLVFIDPDTESGTNHYRSRRRGDHPEEEFSCGVHQLGSRLADPPAAPGKPGNRLPGNLLTYRLAVSATQEYVAAVGGTVAAAQAEIVTAINRVNQFYERDLGIRLLLVAGNDDLIERTDDTCLTNGNHFAMLSENQIWTDSIIGSSGYDIGHVFSTNPGGLAVIESVCNNSSKASASTGLGSRTGDSFYIDYVAHEIGHQFGAEHTFNGTSRSCSGNRVAASAFEPGSGSSIMAYSGICGAENLQIGADATFHAGSISQVDAYTGTGGSCFVPLANGNSDPTLSSLSNRVIPRDTAFVLDNPTAMDADVGDSLSYQWDQMDIGTATALATFGQDLGDNPLFRSYEPQPVSYRDFPALGTQVEGLFDKSEAMACSSRSMNFRLTVRDNASGQATSDVRVTVNRNAGPFEVTSFTTAQTLTLANAPFTLDWNVANTGSGTPVNCANVDIELLTFDDASYTNYSVHPILAGTPNDGSEDITIVPLTHSHPRARIRVRCSDNIFYDISDADLNLVGSSPPMAFSDTDNMTFFNSDGLVLIGAKPACGVPRPGSAAREETVNVFSPPKTAARECVAEPLPDEDSSSYDATAFSYVWLLLMAGLAALRRLYPRQG